MATTEKFNEVLKRYTPFKMIYEEVKKRNWYMENVNKKQDWVGGTMEIPIELAAGGSIAWGQLVDENDIQDGTYKTLTLTNSDLKEAWGAMQFHEKDLRRHASLSQSYLELMPRQLKSFADEMSQQISQHLFSDGCLASITTASTAGASTQGIVVVDSVHLLKVGQKVFVDDGDSAPISGYVAAINVNTKAVKIVTARGGSTQVDLTPYAVAQTAKIYTEGQQANGPTPLKSLLLSSANGGLAQVYNAGFDKDIYPALQAININGSAFTSATLLDDLYAAYFQVLDQGKGSLNKKMVMPMSHFRHFTKSLESKRDFTVTDKKAGYGFTSVKIMGVDGEAEFVGIRDCAKSLIFVLDMDTIHLCGNNFFKRSQDANGNEFYVKRGTSGKINIVDTGFEGENVITNLSHNGIIHSVPTL